MKKKKLLIRSDLIIRLIDVVLILLFGFIAISEISKKSRIDLAKSEAVPASAPDRERVLFIGVLPDGRFLVDEETAIIDSDESLLGYLLQQRQVLNNQGYRIRVRVRANYDAQVKFAFRVVTICQEINIPVGLDVVKKS